MQQCLVKKINSLCKFLSCPPTHISSHHIFTCIQNFNANLFSNVSLLHTHTYIPLSKKDEKFFRFPLISSMCVCVYAYKTQRHGSIINVWFDYGHFTLVVFRYIYMKMDIKWFEAKIHAISRHGKADRREKFKSCEKAI